MDLLTITQTGFVLLSLICLILVFKGIQSATRNWQQKSQKTIKRRFLIGIVVWLLFLALVSVTGFISYFNSIPPPFIVVIIPPIVLLIILSRSKLMAQLLKSVPKEHVLYLQSFRIIVEVFLWFLFLENIAPIQMTFEGLNFDILAGLTAPFAVLLFLKTGKLKKTGLLIWNVFGLLLLANIVSIALLSTPSPFRVFMNEPANTFITQIPFVLLPGLLVPLAYYLHFFSIRQVLKEKRA